MTMSNQDLLVPCKNILLPDEVQDAAHLGGDNLSSDDDDIVVAWTKVVETDKLARFYCKKLGLCSIYCYYCCPCFLYSLLPLYCLGEIGKLNKYRNKYWILTRTELKIVSMAYDPFCTISRFQGRYDEVESIPLTDIAKGGIDNDEGSYFSDSCTSYESTIYVKTVTNKWYVGFGLIDSKDFLRKILNQCINVRKNGTATEQTKKLGLGSGSASFVGTTTTTTTAVKSSFVMNDRHTE